MTTKILPPPHILTPSELADMKPRVLAWAVRWTGRRFGLAVACYRQDDGRWLDDYGSAADPSLLFATMSEALRWNEGNHEARGHDVYGQPLPKCPRCRGRGTIGTFRAQCVTCKGRGFVRGEGT